MSSGARNQMLKNDNTEHNKNKSKKKRSKFKRKAKLFLFYFSILLLIVGVGIFISFTVLFKIETINVEGDTRYDKSEIIALSGIKKGENLLLSKAKRGEYEIETKMPYIGNATISKKIPNTITITVSETSPEGQIESEDGYVVVNLEGKVIDILPDPLENVCVIKVNSIKKPSIGNKIEFDSEENKALFGSLLNEVKNCGIGNIKVIDLSNPMHIFMDYDNRIKVELGSPENIDYKLRTAAIVLKDELQPSDKGKLDVSLSVQNNKTYFTPDYLM